MRGVTFLADLRQNDFLKLVLRIPNQWVSPKFKQDSSKPYLLHYYSQDSKKYNQSHMLKLSVIVYQIIIISTFFFQKKVSCPFLELRRLLHNHAESPFAQKMVNLIFENYRWLP